MADFWEDDEPAPAATNDVRWETVTRRVAGERRSFDDYHEHLDEAEVIACLRAVRDQLADAGPKVYGDLIRQIDGATGDSQAESDDLVGTARAALEGTKYVHGGAIEDLRELLGWDG